MDNFIVVVLPAELASLYCIAVPDPHSVHLGSESVLFVLRNAVRATREVKSGF